METPSPDREKGDWRRSLYPLLPLLWFLLHLHFLCIAPVSYGSTDGVGPPFYIPPFFFIPGTKIVVIDDSERCFGFYPSSATRLCTGTIWTRYIM